MQKRIAFLVHDGSGLGHLQRCARIAAALQGPCACLVVSGHRAAAWMVPTECELLYVPGWDGLFAHKAAHWERRPWWEVSRADAIQFRSMLVRDIVRAFDPHALIVDYLPLGLYGELAAVLEHVRCRKYFLLRGIIDQEDQARFAADYGDAIERHYDHVLVAADPRIIDVVAAYSLRPTIAAKLRYVGYVLPPRAPTFRSASSSGTTQSVVCSGGSGFRAEALLAACTSLAPSHPDVRFDVVLGPRSRANASMSPPSRNGRVFLERGDLAALHATADVVVTTGGYNSLMEAMSGGARVIVYAPASDADEPYEHARRWAAWYPVYLVSDLAHLHCVVARALADAREAPQRPAFPFDECGTSAIRRFILRELEVTV